MVDRTADSGKRRSGSTRLPSAALAFLLAACAGAQLPGPAAEPASDVGTVVYLVGDAGQPEPGGEPVLQALEADLRALPASVGRHVVFLGDNLYPAGMPPLEAGRAPSASRREAERRTLAMLGPTRSTGTPTLLVPGNHDWYGEGGLAAVRRQEAFVEASGGGLATWTPDDGCPGPDVHDVDSLVRIVALDTEWWLREKARPARPDSSCPADSEDEITTQLIRALSGSGSRNVIVVAHHPLETGGDHGGHFSLGQHVFPLRDVHPWLWIPLPVVGSSYPIARSLGIHPQDVSHDRNRAMREAIGSALASAPPLVYASGHSHTLEVHDGGGRAGTLVVSGAGVFTRRGRSVSIPSTRFHASRRAGFAKIEFEQGGRARLSVVTVDRDGGRVEAYSEFLSPPS